MKNKSLKDKVALVTGASSGIGAAIVLKLAQYGTRLCLVGRNTKRLNLVRDKALKQGAEYLSIYKADLENETDIKNLKEKVQDIDILIHSAGVISLGNLEEASVKDLDWHYWVNLRAPYLLTQIFLPTIKKRQGQIVFINSSVVLKAKASTSQYSATKNGLKAIADSLREELEKDGVDVISIFPMSTATPMQKKVAISRSKKYQPGLLLHPEDVAELVVNALTRPRITPFYNSLSLQTMKWASMLIFRKLENFFKTIYEKHEK